MNDSSPGTSWGGIAVAVAAIAVKLLRADLDLSFRYGGF